MRAPVRIDRLGLALAVAVAAAYAFLGAAWPLALGVGALVYTLKLTLDLPWRSYHRRLPPPAPGSLEEGWLARAANAVRSIKELRRSARSPSIAQRCDGIAMQAEASILTLRRLAYQSGLVSALVPPSETRHLHAARPEAAVRLESTRRELHARIEDSVLGLEGLVARLAQIVALSEAGADAASMDELTFELDTLRVALEETEALGRRSVHSLAAPDERGGN
jgi:hypothetical protein